MKSYNITSKHLRQLLIPLFAVFSANGLLAQNTSISPYSRFGVGDLRTTQTPRNVAMGGISVGLTGTSNLSAKNPASYLNLDSLMVNFDVSMYATYSRLQEKSGEETVSANTNSASLGHITFAFPITSWLKSSFGLTPHSNMSYDVIREYNDDPKIGKTFLNNYGQGGLNQVFFGVAIGTNRIAAGVNMNYQFGSFKRQTHFIFSDTILQIPTTTEINTSLEATGFFVDLGIQYKQPLGNRHQLGFGATYTPKYKLNATRNLQVLSTLRHQGGVIVPIYVDDNEDGTLEMPDQYAFGLSLERLNRWVVGAEYSIVNFKNYREFKYNDKDLTAAHTFRLGAELKGKRLDNSFLNRLSYQFGYHYGTNYVEFDGQKLNQFGVSFGLGMPIRRSLSRVDFAVEFGRKGNVNNPKQIQENYGRIIIGISAFDRWFMRGKFD